MATEVKLPDLGEGVEDATVSRWLVKEGDQVKAGDVLLEVATDKVDTEVPAPADGKVLKINVRDGEIVSLGSVLAVLGAEGESAAAAPAAQPPAEAEAPAEQPAAAPKTAPATPPPTIPTTRRTISTLSARTPAAWRCTSPVAAKMECSSKVPKVVYL